MISSPSAAPEGFSAIAPTAGVFAASASPRTLSVPNTGSYIIPILSKSRLEMSAISMLAPFFSFFCLSPDACENNTFRL